jgi:hypothetical protein
MLIGSSLKRRVDVLERFMARKRASDIDHVDEQIRLGLSYATAPRTNDERRLAVALYDELSNQWEGRGLRLKGGGAGDDGRHIVVVDGSIDLIALARRALSRT